MLCEKCNVPHHAECVGHKGPVLGDWYCPSCRTAHGKSRKRGCEVNGATASGTVPWPDEVFIHLDVGSVLHERLAIKPLVALIGTCKAARDSIAFKPAEARAALAEHGKDWLCTHAAGKGNLRLL